MNYKYNANMKTKYSLEKHQKKLDILERKLEIAKEEGRRDDAKDLLNHIRVKKFFIKNL